jgi:predicted nucleotidyltransferase
VYLFGSAARGDSGADSDLDILVVVADDAPSERQRSRAAYSALWGLERSGDIVGLTRSAFARRAGIATSLPGIALREGRLLYAA